MPPRSDWRTSTPRETNTGTSLPGPLPHEKETLVYAQPSACGYWVVTPLRLPDGTTVLVNRGFVPTERREASTRREANRRRGEGHAPDAHGRAERLTPSNRTRPGKTRWYSRDVGAIAAARASPRSRPILSTRMLSQSRRLSRRRLDARRLRQQSPRFASHGTVSRP